MSPLFPSSTCFGFSLVHQLFEDLVQVANNSNLQSLFYDMASTTDYSKEPLNINVMNDPPPSPSKFYAPHRPCHHLKGLPTCATMTMNPLSTRWQHDASLGVVDGRPTDTRCACPHSSPQHIARPMRLCPNYHTSQGTLSPIPSCTSFPLFPPIFFCPSRVSTFLLKLNPLVASMVSRLRQSSTNPFQRRIIHQIRVFLCPM